MNLSNIKVSTTKFTFSKDKKKTFLRTFLYITFQCILELLIQISFYQCALSILL